MLGALFHGNHQVAPGTKIRKAVTVVSVAENLRGIGIDSRAELASRSADAGVERALCAVPGVGIAAWRYLLSLARVEKSKPDTMITRDSRTASGTAQLTSPEVTDLLEAAVGELQVGDAPARGRCGRWFRHGQAATRRTLRTCADIRVGGQHRISDLLCHMATVGVVRLELYVATNVAVEDGLCPGWPSIFSGEVISQRLEVSHHLLSVDQVRSRRKSLGLVRNVAAVGRRRPQLDEDPRPREAVIDVALAGHRGGDAVNAKGDHELNDLASIGLPIGPLARRHLGEPRRHGSGAKSA